MSCIRNEKLWPRFLSGDLSRKKQEQFEKHLATCNSCKEKLEAFESSRNQVLRVISGQEELSPSEWVRIQPNLDQAPGQKRRVAIFTALGATAAAAIVAIVMFFSPVESNIDGVDAGTTVASPVRTLASKDHYEMRMSTSDPKVKIVWVFDRNLQI